MLKLLPTQLSLVIYHGWNWHIFTTSHSKVSKPSDEWTAESTSPPQKLRSEVFCAGEECCFKRGVRSKRLNLHRRQSTVRNARHGWIGSTMHMGAVSRQIWQQSIKVYRWVKGRFDFPSQKVEPRGILGRKRIQLPRGVFPKWLNLHKCQSTARNVQHG